MRFENLTIYRIRTIVTSVVRRECCTRLEATIEMGKRDSRSNRVLTWSWTENHTSWFELSLLMVLYIYDIWCLIYDGCMMYDVCCMWCMMYDIYIYIYIYVYIYMIYDVWDMMDVWCMLYVMYAVCNVWCMMYDMMLLWTLCCVCEFGDWFVILVEFVVVIPHSILLSLFYSFQ